jgi:hypothetical protein
MSGVVREVSSWLETDTAAAGAASAVRAAPTAPLRHFITSISASFSSTEAGAVLTLEEGTSTVLGTWHVYDSREIVFPSPIAVTPGLSVHADLAAGTGTGAVNMTGYTL